MKLKTCCILLVLFFARMGSAQNWQSVNGGFGGGEPNCIFSDTVNNILYATGSFTVAGGINASHIAKWNGSVWDSIGNGVPNFTSSAHAFDMYNGDLVFVGTIFHPWHSQIAKWNGTGWDSIGSNFRDNFHGIKVLNNELYAYGEFAYKNGTYYNSIAKWNGTDWVSLGFSYQLDGQPAIIACLAMYHGELYAGGIFTDSVGGPTENIAKYDGTSWSIVGGGIHGNMDAVDVMEVYNDELYIGGTFQTSSGNISNGIVKWNGSGTLQDVGGGITSTFQAQIDDLLVFDNKLFAVGFFDNIGGIPANYIASWDGTNWCGYGTADNPYAYRLASINHELYIATNQEWDNDTVNNIAKSIGTPVADTCGNLSVGINEATTNDMSFIIYPNPATDQITIEFTLTDTKQTAVEIKNVLGQTINSIDSGFSIGKNQIEINSSEYSQGIYFIQLQNGNKLLSKKIVRQ